ncbi:MAG: hypothetical protein RLZZ303_947 [Candidatus Hydrogenedentota bacterium]|jgi:chemotaxis protein CheD
MGSASAAAHLQGQLVPMGQMRIASGGLELLGTRALGSCIAVALRDGGGRASGLAHCMLPLSQIDAASATVEPCTFTDSGIAALRDALLTEGAAPAGIKALLVGGACLLGDASTPPMGKRNVQVARMLLEQFEIEVIGEAVGGTLPRSLWFNAATGAAEVFCAGRREVLGA